MSVLCLLATVNTSSLLPQLLWQQLLSVSDVLNKPIENIHWVVALSGGKDSTALAHAMGQCTANLRVTLCHIHHGLQSIADEWVSHCEQQAQKLDFNYHFEKVSVDTSSRQSIEANARDARYQALRSFCRETDGVLLLAQHQDDQLETVLLQLKRGAGPKGLSGMAQQQWAEQVLQVRPWLNVSQLQIQDYVEQFKLRHVHDPSNSDNQFDRNFLRNQVLPLLTERWPGLASAVGRTAELCAGQNRLIEEQAHNWLRGHQSQNNRIALSDLNILSSQWQREVIRYWAHVFAGELPSKAQLDEFFKGLKSESDRIPELQFNQVLLRRFGGFLYISTDTFNIQQHDKALEQTQFDSFILTQWGMTVTTVESEYSLDDIVFNVAIRSTDSFAVKWVQNSERLSLGANRIKSAKSLFKDYKVPPWCRQATLGLFINEKLVAFIHQEGVSEVRRSGDRHANLADTHAYLVVSHHTGRDLLA